MFGTLFRVLFGFVVACLVTGLIIVGFVVPPGAILALPEPVMHQELWRVGELTLAAATQSAVFAAPFALVAAAIAEWQSLRGMTYYAFVGLAISAGGFLSLWAGEQFTTESYYAMAAYGASGLFGGIAYWLLAGQWAGEPPYEDEPVLATSVAPLKATRVTAAPPTAPQSARGPGAPAAPGASPAPPPSGASPAPPPSGSSTGSPPSTGTPSSSGPGSPGGSSSSSGSPPGSSSGSSSTSAPGGTPTGASSGSAPPAGSVPNTSTTKT